MKTILKLIATLIAVRSFGGKRPTSPLIGLFRWPSLFHMNEMYFAVENRFAIALTLSLGRGVPR